MTRGLRIALAVALASLVDASPADAYHNADFATPVTRGGGNGMYFTGSPRYKRLDCTACHALAEERIGIELSSTPGELIAEGRYTPGVTYTLEVTMTGEHRGDPQATNRYDHNSFVAELNDDGGRVVGAWASDDPERVYTMDVAGGDPQIVLGYDGAGGTRWTAGLTAPAAGTGRITLYLGAVDGNAAGGGVETVVDPFGDDVFVGAWRFCEGASSCDRTLPEPTEEQIDDAHDSTASGCAAGGTADAGAALLMLALAAWWSRRRAAMLVACVAVAGCLDKGTDPAFEPCPNDICEYSTDDDPFGDAPTLNRPYFRCEVQPMLQARCANFACHGDNDRPLAIYAPFRLRLDGDDSESVEPTTTLETTANFDVAREFSMGGRSADSLLTLKPLDTQANGYYHFGESLYYQSDVFTTTSDLGYVKLAAWIDGATASADCRPTQEVGP